jgi:competence protein ComEA
MRRAVTALLLATVLGLQAGTAAAEGPEPAPCRDTAAATPATGPLNLNTASEAELLDLPGIGPSRAQAIIAFRDAHGGFQSVSQLLKIKGFGRAMLRRLRPLLVAEPAP